MEMLKQDKTRVFSKKVKKSKLEAAYDAERSYEFAQRQALKNEITVHMLKAGVNRII